MERIIQYPEQQRPDAEEVRIFEPDAEPHAAEC